MTLHYDIYLTLDMQNSFFEKLSYNVVDCITLQNCDGTIWCREFEICVSKLSDTLQTFYLFLSFGADFSALTYIQLTFASDRKRTYNANSIYDDTSITESSFISDSCLIVPHFLQLLLRGALKWTSNLSHLLVPWIQQWLKN